MGTVGNLVADQEMTLWSGEKGRGKGRGRGCTAVEDLWATMVAQLSM
jgi:hypothetical protein